MEVLRELDVERFLTRGGKVFVSSQFHIPWDPERQEGRSDPDLVALDFKAQEVVVVEVTTASSLGDFLAEIEKRQTKWYSPIKRHLEDIGAFPEGWTIRFLGFVRKACIERARARFASADDVSFFSIEDATFDWDYWTKRLHGGLPRDGVPDAT